MFSDLPDVQCQLQILIITLCEASEVVEYTYMNVERKLGYFNFDDRSE